MCYEWEAETFSPPPVISYLKQASWLYVLQSFQTNEKFALDKP